MDPASHLIGSGASAQPIESEVRATGIRAIGDVPWGTHFFLFYETKEDSARHFGALLQGGVGIGGVLRVGGL